MAELYGYPVTGSNGLTPWGTIVAKKWGPNWGASGGPQS